MLVSRSRNDLNKFLLARWAVGRGSSSLPPYLPCLWNGPLSLISVAGQPQKIVYQTPYISRARPPRLSGSRWRAGLHVAPIDMMGASNELRGHLGCGSVRPPPDGP